MTYYYHAKPDGLVGIDFVWSQIKNTVCNHSYSYCGYRKRVRETRQKVTNYAWCAKNNKLKHVVCVFNDLLPRGENLERNSKLVYFIKEIQETYDTVIYFLCDLWQKILSTKLRGSRLQIHVSLRRHVSSFF